MLPWCKPQGLAGAPEGGGGTRNHAQLGVIFGLCALGGLQDSAPPRSERCGLGGAAKGHNPMCPPVLLCAVGVCRLGALEGVTAPPVPLRSLGMKPSTQAAPLASGSGVDLHIQGTGIDVRMHGLHGLGTYRGDGGGMR